MRTMPHRGLLATWRSALLGITLLACLAPATMAKEKGPRVEPLLFPNRATTLPPYSIVGQAIELQTNGIRMRVEPLSETRREAYFRLRTHLERDPLPSGPLAPNGFTVFEISFENQSGRDFMFNPSQSACLTGKDTELLPYHLDNLFDFVRTVFAGRDQGDQKAIAALEVFHHGRLVLKHGQRASRIMVYEGCKARTEQIVMELGPLVIGPEILSPTIIWSVVHP